MAKTKALISFAVPAKLICVFGFAYADCWFSHEAAQMAREFYVMFFYIFMLSCEFPFDNCAITTNNTKKKLLAHSSHLIFFTPLKQNYLCKSIMRPILHFVNFVPKAILQTEVIMRWTCTKFTVLLTRKILSEHLIFSFSNA